MEKNVLSMEIEKLKKDMNGLYKEVARLKLSLERQMIDSLKEMIQRRGLRIFRENPTEMLLISQDTEEYLQDIFYEMLKKYSFRLFLRDIIKERDSFRVESLTRYCCTDVAEKYLKFLKDLGVVQHLGHSAYRLISGHIHSFGPTLEWFVAEIFKREFLSPAIYGVNFKDTSVGGDYDVLAAWEQHLVYVEVKSSPPKGIEMNEVKAFFRRTRDLSPHIAIFLVDTELRMKDKVVVMFEQELTNRYGSKSVQHYPVQRLVDELFHINNSVFVINSRKNIVSNLLTCIKHHLYSQSMRL